MTWKPTPEVKALHDTYFAPHTGVIPRAGIVYPVIDGDTIHFPKPILRNGRLCCQHNGMWFILGASL